MLKITVNNQQLSSVSNKFKTTTKMGTSEVKQINKKTTKIQWWWFKLNTFWIHRNMYRPVKNLFRRGGENDTESVWFFNLFHFYSFMFSWLFRDDLLELKIASIVTEFGIFFWKLCYMFCPKCNQSFWLRHLYFLSQLCTRTNAVECDRRRRKSEYL